jgi:hypothetical protein
MPEWILWMIAFVLGALPGLAVVLWLAKITEPKEDRWTSR